MLRNKPDLDCLSYNLNSHFLIMDNFIALVYWTDTFLWHNRSPLFGHTASDVNFYCTHKLLSQFELSSNYINDHRWE